MTTRFQRGALAAVASLVMGLIVAVVASPLERGTAVPKASLRIAASQPVPPILIDIDRPARPVAEAAAGAPPPRGGEAAPAPEATTGVVSVSARQPHYSARLLRTSDALSRAFNRLGYDLNLIRSGEAKVPRLFLASLPADLKDVRGIGHRKALFFKTVLPLVLQVNEEILRDRRRLWRLHVSQRMGQKHGPVDRLWLMVMAERYGAKRNIIDTLLKRVDMIPPSLALAQAAEESGWGTSRFVREGNAVFGQWTFSETGSLIPLDRDDDKSHKIKSFPSLVDSVRAYVRNLNTHRAYREMRSVRQELRLRGAPIDGLVLADHMESYSARGEDYIDTIKTIIGANDLHHLDDARLHRGQPTPRPAI